MKQLLEQLAEVKKEITVKKEFLDEAKARKEIIENKILEEMNKLELKSARYDGMTATISKRKTLKVTDEKELVKYLKDNRLTDYLSERPNELFQVYLKEAEKQEKIVPGTELTQTEYLTVRNKE